MDCFLSFPIRCLRYFWRMILHLFEECDLAPQMGFALHIECGGCSNQAHGSTDFESCGSGRPRQFFGGGTLRKPHGLLRIWRPLDIAPADRWQPLSCVTGANTRKCACSIGGGDWYPQFPHKFFHFPHFFPFLHHMEDAMKAMSNSVPLSSNVLQAGWLGRTRFLAFTAFKLYWDIAWS